MASDLTDRLAGVRSSLAIKAPVRVATTANITLSGLQTIDGVALAANDRVLVKDQTTGANNGIYVASTGPWQRAKDWNGSGDVVTGTMVLVTDGSTNTGRWSVTTSGTITIGTTSITLEAEASLVIGNGSVTYAKIQDVSATQRVLARDSSGSGSVEEVAISDILDWLGTTQGSVLYRGASGWSELAPGTSGQYLKTTGTGSDPTWATPAGAGDMLMAIYDPTGKADDAFDMDNMVEGSTNLILTAAEREAIGAVEGLVADFSYTTQTGTDNAAALQAAIDAAPEGGTVVIPAGYYRVASALTWADKSLSIAGMGPQSTHLIFDGCNGFVAVVDDASNKGVRFRGFSAVTTGNGVYTAIDYTGVASAGGQIAEALIHDVAMFGADRIKLVAWGANPNYNTCTWLTGIKLTNADVSEIRSCTFYANERSLMDAWPQATTCIHIDDCTTVYVQSCKIQRWETGVYVEGTSENTVINKSNIVACRYAYRNNTTNPNNQDIITENHMSSYDYEMYFEGGGSFHTVAHNFLMRREDATSTGYWCLKGPISFSAISYNQFAQVSVSLAPVTSGDVAVSITASGADNDIAHNLFYRCATCVDVASGCNRTAISGNKTVDDGNTIAVSAYVDAGTSTRIFDNGGHRPSRALDNGGSAAVEWAVGSSSLFRIGTNKNKALSMTQGSASAVSWIDVVNAATGVASILRVQSDDSNADLDIQAKGSGAVGFKDNQFRVTDNSDTTKKVALELSGLTTGTTRTLTVQDVSGTVYVSGGSDVPVTDGGTGASTAQLAAKNLRIVYVLDSDGTEVSLTGSTSETVMKTITVPAGSLGANGWVDVELLLSMDNNANTKTYRVRTGATGIGLSGTAVQAIALASLATYHPKLRIWNKNSTSSQSNGPNNGVFGSGGASVFTASAIDTTSAWDIVITGQLANAADTAKVSHVCVTLHYAD